MTRGQRTEDCDILPSSSTQENDGVDVHCNCMQRLTQTDLSISQLTINQTGCSDIGLELLWSDLESMVSPSRLVLVGARVFFVKPRPRPTASAAASWTPSISSVFFNNCTFEYLPSHAFRGMRLLANITFNNGYIGIVKSNAFSHLPQLKKVEISNVTMGVMESRCFNNLPALQDLHIIHSNVREMETEAVSLLSHVGQTSRCDVISDSTSLANGGGEGRNDVVGSDEGMNVVGSDEGMNVVGGSEGMTDVVGRELFTSVSNLSLPEYGSRILLFKNNIEVVSPHAITTDTFGFLIVGGNYIGHLGTEAFNMELYNECEIAAALFVGNIFGKVDKFGLAGVRGRDGMSYQTFLALSNNTFLDVSSGGFTLPPSLVIFTLKENHFDCSCDKLDWVHVSSDDENTNRQLTPKQNVVKELVQESYCLDGYTKLSTFTSTCNDDSNRSNSTNTNYTTTTTTTTTTTPPTDSSATKVTSLSMTACVLTLVFGWLLSSPSH
ncbi:hypothetical protein Pmani_022101 [Petrolisthes manimaculis]|uniref:Uncharacterized protein n=1 Tax=Petrolisthes manimaculis TaxID=1843537 RepID=A0AAE1PCS3_9EUCA|nr:hypothetical protein Pmani_022101 [Petrolisthes manimaculis]